MDASASVTAKVARKLRLRRVGASGARIASRGVTAAARVVVARGHVNAAGARTVKIRLKPTKAAQRVAKRMCKVVLAIRVSQVGGAGATTVRLK